jgi:O-antigen ligase
VNTRRVDIWRATWLMIKAHPIAGVGFGGYWIAVPQYHDASGAYTPQQAHNDYLEVAASGGIIGAAICVWFGVMLITRLKRTLGQAGAWRRAACAGAAIGLLGVAVHSMFDFGVHLTINAALFMVLVVIGTAEIEAGSQDGRAHV